MADPREEGGRASVGLYGLGPQHKISRRTNGSRRGARLLYKSAGCAGAERLLAGRGRWTSRALCPSIQTRDGVRVECNLFHGLTCASEGSPGHQEDASAIFTLSFQVLFEVLRTDLFLPQSLASSSAAVLPCPLLPVSLSPSHGPPPSPALPTPLPVLFLRRLSSYYRHRQSKLVSAPRRPRIHR